jgi:hypothetical protein
LEGCREFHFDAPIAACSMNRATVLGCEMKATWRDHVVAVLLEDGNNVLPAQGIRERAVSFAL